MSEIIPYEDNRKAGPGGKYKDFPAQSTTDEIQDFKISNMADAMQLARSKLRDVGDEDPDPYGYAQELENELDIDLLEPEWKSRPDDQRWVKRIKGRARKAEVAKLFLGGYKPHAIAQMLGVSEQTIHNDIAHLGQEWRRAYIGDIEILAGKDLERLESYLVALGPGIERGDFKSISTALEIIKERASILGYRQGVQIDIEQYVREVAEAHGYDPDKAVQMAQRISVTLKG
jgi:hypothetical protein